MKHKTLRLITLLLMLVVVVSLICVTGSAAENSDAKEETESFNLVEKAKEALTDAPYIGEYYQDATKFVQDNQQYMWIVLGVLALIECFFGYRLLKIELFLGGLFGGFIGGLMLCPYIDKIVSNLPDYVDIIVAAVCAIIGALLVHFLFRVAIFAAVGFFVFNITANTFANVQNGQLYRILLAIGCAIIATLLVKFFFVIASGALCGVYASAKLFSKVEFMTKPLYKNADIFKNLEFLGVNALNGALIVGVVIAVLGIIFQFANTRRKRV